MFWPKLQAAKAMCTDIDLTEKEFFQVWIEMFINYSSLEYSEFILAFQLQFEHMKQQVNIFDGEIKEKRHFNQWFSS